MSSKLAKIEPTGKFNLRLKFGEDDILVNLFMLKELTIIQDWNYFLPMFKLSLLDSTGDLIHTIPFDRGMSKVEISLADDYQSENRNTWDFLVYRRKPISDTSQSSGVYTINGLLNIKGLYAPNYSRAFNQNIVNTLTSIAKKELAVSNLEIDPSLNYSKNLIQPGWFNLKFLNYLKSNLIGLKGESNYKTFIKCKDQKNWFVFNSAERMLSASLAYKFILRDTPYEDRYPIYNYHMMDNYGVHNVFASKKQAYSYFDYTQSKYITTTLKVEDFLSATDFFLIDKDDSDISLELAYNGRSNSFTSNFEGKIKTNYYDRLLGLMKIWITTKGIPNISPGDLVEIFFPQGVIGDKLYSYQYSGYWLVQRVVQMVGSTYMTKLLLTRTGVDTDRPNTLVKAAKKR